MFTARSRSDIVFCVTVCHCMSSCVIVCSLQEVGLTVSFVSLCVIVCHCAFTAKRRSECAEVCVCSKLVGTRWTVNYYFVHVHLLQ